MELRRGDGTAGQTRRLAGRAGEPQLRRPRTTRLFRAAAAIALAAVVVVLAAQHALGAPASPPAGEDGGDGDRIAQAALQLAGYPYVEGGSSPADGFDANGLVWWVYGQVGIAIPRDLPGQLSAGQRVGREELQPGDVVFFHDTYDAGLSHAGIYVGKGQFVNAVDEDHGVAVSSLDRAYWQAHYLGASRPWAARPAVTTGSSVAADDEAAVHRLMLAYRGGQRPSDPAPSAPASPPPDDSAVSQDAATLEIGARIAAAALQFRGYPYAWGGRSPQTGFDCSGLVYYVYSQFGIVLPRDVAGQFTVGRRVSRDELQPGDVVFFQNTYAPGLSHAGIYVGGGQFIHAVDEEHGVAVSSLDGVFWQPRYVGARRPGPAGP